MTIVAGFLYDKGLLLCADTQFTGQIKLAGSKVLPYTYDDKSKSVFLVVGNARYARMCVQLIQDSVAALPKSDRTIAKMHQIIMQGILALYQDHIFTRPRPDDVIVQYLIGLWSEQDKALAFFSTEETAVARMYGYDCLGSGEILAHHFIRPRYRRVASIAQTPRHTEEQVKKLALEALREVKKYDPYCGGHTEYLTLNTSGEMSKVGKLKIASC